MTVRSGADVVGNTMDPLLEELLLEIVSGTRSDSRAGGAESVASALTEAVMVSFSRVVVQASEVDRKLLAEALAPALAGLLAPALAQALAPRIVATLSRIATAPEKVAPESEWGRREKTKPGTVTNGSSGKGVRK